MLINQTYHRSRLNQAVADYRHLQAEFKAGQTELQKTNHEVLKEIEKWIIKKKPWRITTAESVESKK